MIETSNDRVVIRVSERRVEGALPMSARLSLHTVHNICIAVVVYHVAIDMDLTWLLKKFWY